MDDKEPEFTPALFSYRLLAKISQYIYSVGGGWILALRAGGRALRAGVNTGRVWALGIIW